MLILDQVGKTIVNADNCTCIVIEPKTNSIKAKGKDGETFYLGTYQNLDDCKEVLFRILCKSNDNYSESFRMPLGGELQTVPHLTHSINTILKSE